MQPMRIHTAFVAHRASVDGGNLDVVGGFPGWWSVPEIPSTVTLALVVVGQLTPKDLTERYTTIAVDVHEQGVKLGQVAKFEVMIGDREGDWVDGAPEWFKHIEMIDVGVGGVGPFAFEVRSDEGEPFRVPLAFRLAPDV